MEVSGQLHAPAALSPRKEQTVPVDQEDGASLGATEELKSLPLPGIEPRLLGRPTRVAR
jgi:hypothetical protein